MKIRGKRSGTGLITRQGHVAAKRVIDTALVLLTAPLTIPAALLTAAAVRSKLGSPVIFKQQRIGLDEQPFTLFKFRSMLPETSPTGKELTPAERLTPFGKALRKSSLDELPQLWNVLRGDMSLVGPRPLLPEYLPHYKEMERARHSVRPGVTGASQVSGRNTLGWDNRLLLDADYARYGTVAGDFAILASTVVGVLKRSGTHADPWGHGEYLSVERSYPSDARLGLRRLEPDDAAIRVRWMSDPRTSALMNVPEQITVAETARWVVESRAPGRKDLVAYEHESGEPCAMLGVRAEFDLTFPEVHVFVDPDRQGEGLGTAAMALLVEWLRNEQSCGCWLTVSPDNIAAKALYEKLGFQIVGDTRIPRRLRMELRW